MNVLKDFAIDIDSGEVASRLQCSREQEESVREIIEQEIKNCQPIIKPQITLEKLKITNIKGNMVLLENGIVFESVFMSQKLAHCQYIVVSVSTLGLEIDDYIRNLFDDDDYLRGLAADNIAISALGSLGKILWERLVDELRGTGIGMTSRLSPGDTGWELSQQHKLFKCFDNSEDIGVTLIDSGMMMPIKSSSAVYGFGDGIGITRFGHVCSECTMKDCTYRIIEKHEVIVNKGSQKTVLNVEHGDNLFEVLRKNKLLENFPCGGNGTCGKCKVKITFGVPKPSPEDENHLTSEELESGVRLACKIKIHAPMELSIDGFSYNNDLKIITEGRHSNIIIEPIVNKKHIVLEKTNADDCRSDLQRVADGIGVKYLGAGLSTLRELSTKLWESEYDFTATTYNNTLICIENGDTEIEKYGIAADIGTTTVVCYLVDLLSGRTLDVEAQANSQVAYGADVISRIGYTSENLGGTKILKDLIVGQINEIIGCLSQRSGITSLQIYNMTVSGNTTMIHLLLGLTTKNIALAPFTPVITANADFKAEEVGLNINGIVSILPSIASYVGSDITAGILTCGMMESDKHSLLIDLGTNGEITLGNKSGLIACSVAAGPAFEGGNIKYGVAGIKGAISKVELKKQNWCTTIGGASACGICGSGVLDTVSELLKYGIIDETGRMASKESIIDQALAQRLIEDGGVRMFVLEQETALGYPIAFTQKDVREVQLAKAAISAGIQMLLKERGIGFEDIEKVYIAGGFGNFMNMESAVNIGLIPRELRDKTVSAGNTSGAGAIEYLLSKTSRKKAAQIADSASYIELSNKKDFQNYYIDAMTFE